MKPQRAKHLIWAAAFLLGLCAVLHSLAWPRTQAEFSLPSQPLAALLWFLLAVDWLTVAGLWLMGAAKGAAARPLLLLSLVVPVAVAVGLLLTYGPGFPPVYLQLAAAGLLLLGTLHLN